MALALCKVEWQFEYPSAWLRACPSSSTQCRNVDGAAHLATEWLNKWTEPRNQWWLPGDCFLVSRQPPVRWSVRAKKATTAENKRIPLKLVRGLLIQVLAGKGWGEMLINECYRFFCEKMRHKRWVPEWVIEVVWHYLTKTQCCKWFTIIIKM